jgi:uncharacterized phage-like protein YoqJ
LINKTVCFSGHRPEKLPGRGDNSREETIFIKNLLKEKIAHCILDGYTRFFSGTARGIDLWAAEEVIRMRDDFPDITLVCVKPFEDQGMDFPSEDRRLYEKIITLADSVVCTSECYSRNCYSIRNKYMVDNSALLIAFVRNYRSGTGQTINYAGKLGKKTDITDLTDMEFIMKYEQLSF